MSLSLGTFSVCSQTLGQFQPQRSYKKVVIKEKREFEMQVSGMACEDFVLSFN